jgi:BirA family biotin operon repressor/biotin-[acetyl-CoA-carboxylase] ligase
MEQEFILQIHETVTSTMDTARHFVSTWQDTPPHQQAEWQGILTYEQTEGRGQRGRNWFARPKQSLCATFLYHSPTLTPQGGLSFALLAGVAVAHATKELAGETQTDIGLKWPNDLLLNGKKTGGILVEMVQSPRGTWVVLVGIGINLTITDFPPEIAPLATSLNKENLSTEPPEQFAKRIMSHLKAYTHLLTQKGFTAISEQWQAWDRTTGKTFLFEEDGQSVRAVAVGITPTGLLRLRGDEGAEFIVQSASSLKEL